MKLITPFAIFFLILISPQLLYANQPTIGARGCPAGTTGIDIFPEDSRKPNSPLIHYTVIAGSGYESDLDDAEKEAMREFLKDARLSRQQCEAAGGDLHNSGDIKYETKYDEPPLSMWYVNISTEGVAYCCSVPGGSDPGDNVNPYY